eukprot:s126_g47.t1
MVLMKGSANACWKCGRKWFKCEDTTYVPPDDRTPKNYQEPLQDNPFGDFWNDDGGHWQQPKSPRQAQPQQVAHQQGKGQSKGKNQPKKSKGKGKGGQKWPHQVVEQEEDQYLPPSTRWLNPPSVPTPTEQAAGSGAVLPTALQPFSKTKAERDKEEAELNSLRQLRDTLKAKPQNELTEDVKKAIQVAEQHARKEDSKTHRNLVDQLQKARKSLGEVEEQWNAFRVQWSTYLDQATKLWKSHVENYELGETKWSQRRQEAVQHLHRVRARLHEVHVRTMSTDGAYQDVNLQHAQAALDDAMLIEEQDLTEDQEVLAQAKEKLIGIVGQVRTNIEARVKKRDRSVPRAEEIQESDEEATGKRGTGRNRFRSLSFWPHVHCQDDDGQVTLELCNFEEPSYENAVPFSWSPWHSVFRNPTFCSLWEAQSRAFVLQSSLVTNLFDLDFDDKTNCWIPFPNDPDADVLNVIQFKPDPAHAPALPDPQPPERERTPPDRPRPDPFAPFDAWVRQLWNLLDAEGQVEQEEEGAVMYLQSYYISHQTNRRQEQGRPVRLDGNFRDWPGIIADIWRDLMDDSQTFQVHIVIPDPPIPVTHGTVGTILVVQHPQRLRAACLTTVLSPDVPLIQKLETAHSLDIQVPYHSIIDHAGARGLCDHREQHALGRCIIKVGRRELPYDEPVRTHDGLGLLIDVPAPLPGPEWDDVIFRHLQSTSTAIEYTWGEQDESDTQALMQQSLHHGGPSSSSTSTDSSSSASLPAPKDGNPALKPEVWRRVAAFSSDCGVRHLQVPERDDALSYSHIAKSFNIDISRLLCVYQVPYTPQDLRSEDLEAVIIQRVDQPAPSSLMRYVLAEVEYIADTGDSDVRVERGPRWIPHRCNRASIIRLLGYEAHCHFDPRRCHVQHNDQIIPPDQGPPVDLQNGDYILVQIPFEVQSSNCPDETASDVLMDMLDQVGDSDFDSDEIQLMQTALSDQDCRLSEHQHLLRDLHHLWRQHARPNSGTTSTPTVFFDCWYLDGDRFPRCSTRRTISLGREITSWDSSLRHLWRDRVDSSAPSRVIPVPNALPGTSCPHLILAQGTQADLRHVIISIITGTGAQASCSSHAQTLAETTTFQELLHYCEVDRICQTLGYTCDAFITGEADQYEHEEVLRDGNHIEIRLHEPEAQPSALEIPTDEHAILQSSIQRFPPIRMSSSPSETAKWQCRGPCFPTDHFDSEVDHPNYLMDEIQVLPPAENPGPNILAQPAAIQELYQHRIGTLGTIDPDPPPAFSITTWHLDFPHVNACENPRTVLLPTDFTRWLPLIVEAWEDQIDMAWPINLHVVRPNPPATAWQPREQVHLIVLQRSPADQAANLLSIVNHLDREPVRQRACFAPLDIQKSEVIMRMRYIEACFPERSSFQCMVWQGDTELVDDLRIRNRHGLLFVLIYNHVGPNSDDLRDPWEDEEDLSLLQLGSLRQHRTTLSLEKLIPVTTAVRLIDGTGSKSLPTPLEVPIPGSAAQVQAELCHWGHRREVHACPVSGIFLCLVCDTSPPATLRHYVFWHDDPDDPDGCILHSASEILTEQDIMTFLCCLGYARAVVMEEVVLAQNWHFVVFHHREPLPVQYFRPSKEPTVWPARGKHRRTAQTMFDLKGVTNNDTTCKLRTAFGLHDLKILFESGQDVLCTDFSLIPLDDAMSTMLQQLPVTTIRDSKDLDQFDRLLIFTDGSSQPAMKRKPPAQADELGWPDTWAMVVIGEIFIDEYQTATHLCGWAAYPVRYDCHGSAYYGIDTIGSDSAERAALIGAAMWRLSQNHMIPTLICTDSLTGKGQASGELGTAHMDDSFYLLRGLYQALHLALSPDYFEVVHVRAHTGILFNEIADAAAKQEAKQSFHCARQQLDMQQWRPFFVDLWTLFGDRAGLPVWQEGGMAVTPPALPQRQPQLPEPENSVQDKASKVHFRLSLATANVQSLYRGPQGHAGKLHYLQHQMRSHHLAVFAIQEARSEQGMTCHQNILRIASGHCDGQYGIELWYDLDAPYAYHRGRKPMYLNKSDFVVVHCDPRRLLVRVTTDYIQLWFFACHAPHSGRELQERVEWWETSASILTEHIDDAPLFLLADANAEPGPRDDQVVFRDDLRSSVNTSLLRDFLAQWSLPLQYQHTRDNVQKLLQIPTSAWGTDVETQAEALSSKVHQLLLVDQTTQAKKPYVSTEIWELRALKLQWRKKLKQTRAMLAKQLMFQIFAAWKETKEVTEEEHAYCISLSCQQVKHLAGFRTTSSTLTHRLRHSKQRALRADLEQLDAQATASDVLRVLRPYTGPSNPRKCKKGTLPMIRDNNGHMCTLPTELTDAWVDFFQEMEGGVRMPYHHLREIWITELEQFQQDVTDVTTDQLPKLTDLEAALRRIPRGRTCGPDGIPGEVCLANPTVLAQHLYPHLLKTTLHGHEYIGFKGGRLTPVHKGRGAIADRRSYRSLLVSNHFGKSIHRAMRNFHAPLYERFLQLQQSGGRRKVPVQMALHQLRAWQRDAHHQGLSCGVLFLDLTEAFYRILREAPMGGEVSDELIAHLMKRLNMPDDSLHQIHQLLQEPSALAQAGMSEMDQRALRAVHTSTHFWVRGQLDVSRTRMGTRPGDSLADFIFGFAWSCVLAKVQNFMIESGFIQWLPGLERLPLFGCGSGISHPQIPFIGPNWMDDLALTIQAPSASQLISWLGCVSGFLLDTCRFHCLSPNLQPGKTELMMTFRGAGSRHQRIRFYGPHADRRFPVVCEGEVCYIQLVTQYKHLGSIAHHTGEQKKELSQKAAVAHGAFNQHRKVLFQNGQLPIARRTELFQMLVLSKFLYGADSWIATDACSAGRFKTSVMSLYRRLLKLPGDCHIGDEDLLVRGGMPSAEELMRRARLRYIVTLVQAGISDLWALLHKDIEWCRLLEQDMIWMWHQLSRSSDLKDPRQHYEQWYDILLHSPKYWKRLVRRAIEHSVLQRKRDFLVRQMHVQAITRCHEALQLDPPHFLSADSEEHASYGCMQCQKRCRNAAGEAAHMHKVHGEVSNLRQLFDQPTCGSCLKHFHTMAKLKAHLYYSRTCRDRLRSSNMQCGVEPGTGSDIDQARALRHDRYLPPLPGQGPHLPAPRPRAFVDINHAIYDLLIQTVSEFTDIVQFEAILRRGVEQTPISWSSLRRTLQFFIDALEDEDATFFGFDLTQMRSLIHSLRQPEAWPFLKCPLVEAVHLPAVTTLERHCGVLQQHIGAEPPVLLPRSFGAHRILLHAYSGRRRVGDLQFYLEKMPTLPGVVLHIVSMDIVIHAKDGDATDPATRAFWLGAIRSRFVIAFVSGPPCETWSRARAVQLEPENQMDGPVEFPSAKGPRVLRDVDHAWGYEAVRLRELIQLIVGNELLGFSLLAIVEISLADAHGILEHPAEAADLPGAASIWRLPLMDTILSMPNAKKIAQGLMGARTTKPTSLLTINLPHLLNDLHSCRVRKDNPVGSAIGKNAQGHWKTTELKEYGPALCKAMAISISRGINCTDIDPNAACPTEAFLDRVRALVVQKYGSGLGADFAGPGAL